MHRGAHEDRVHAIVNEVHLPAAAQFLFNRRLDQLLMEMRDDGIDRKAIFRRAFR